MIRKFIRRLLVRRIFIQWDYVVFIEELPFGYTILRMINKEKVYIREPYEKVKQRFKDSRFYE